MRLLEGKCIDITDNLKIHKVNMSDVNDIGYTKYNQVVRMICVTNEQILEIVKSDEVSVYSFIILNIIQSLSGHAPEDSFADDFILVLEHIFHEKVHFDNDLFCFKVGQYGVLHSENFNDFQNIIKIRNCLESIEEDMDNPDSERAKQLLEKRKKLRQRVDKGRKSSNDDDDNITMIDLISIFAASEHMKLESVFEYDIYQFNDQFNRMRIFKDYDVNIQALLAGAKSEDINMQHWLSKIKNK